MDGEKQNRAVDIGHEATARNIAVEPSVELQIDELVLHGFMAADRYAIADAVQRELTHLLAPPEMRAIARHRSQVARLDGGMFKVKGGSPGRVVGAQVAQALFGSLVSAGKNSEAKGSKRTVEGSRQR